MRKSSALMSSKGHQFIDEHIFLRWLTTLYWEADVHGSLTYVLGLISGWVLPALAGIPEVLPELQDLPHDAALLPELVHVLAHGLLQVPVLLGVREVLLVVGRLQHQVRDIHDAHHATTVPEENTQRGQSLTLFKRFFVLGTGHPRCPPRRYSSWGKHTTWTIVNPF